MDERFRRAGAILGDAAMKRLSESRVAVLGLGAAGYASIWAAVFADVGVSVISILNAMRALRFYK